MLDFYKIPDYICFMRISVAEVALKAGVSPATVSRVLHGGSGVSPDKTARVRQVLNEAQSMPRMRVGRSRPATNGVVAVLFLQPDGLHSSSIELYRTLLHVEEALQAKGFDTLFAVVRHEGSMPQAVVEGKVDGLLLAGVDYPSRFKSVVERFPAVWLTSHHRENDDLALAGNEEIGRMAADWLLSKGHRHLAYIQIPENHPVHFSRGEFFDFTTQRAGRTVVRFKAQPPALTGSDPEDWDNLYQCVCKQVELLKKTKPLPTAAFVPVGLLTGLLYRALSENGLKPGIDVEVVCCDQNRPMLCSLQPRPTSIQIDTEQIARRAVEELTVLIGGQGHGGQGVRISIAPRLWPGSEK